MRSWDIGVGRGDDGGGDEGDGEVESEVMVEGKLLR